MPRPFVSRLDRLGTVDSTQRVVREWLAAGVDEVCIATAETQTAGQGRYGRTWTAPPGTALLVSAGFRPSTLAPGHAWRLGAVAAQAMLAAARDVAGLGDGTLWLKWPNDLVADGHDGRLRKVAGVLGETFMQGDRLVSAVVGIGVNADWPADAFPPHLAGSMTSLGELSGGRPIDTEGLLAGWLARLEPAYEALVGGRFDADAWCARQRTTGRRVEVDTGGRLLAGIAEGVDVESGALLVRPDGTQAIAPVGSGEVVRCRLVEAPAGG